MTAPVANVRAPLSWSPWIYVIVALVVVAAVLRIYVAISLGVHIDEPASIQAAMVTAAHGVPVLPSGVLYLQGATLSYMLAPFVPLDASALAMLETLRWPSVVGGVLAVGLVAAIGRQLRLPAWATALAVAALALHPVAILWSARVRPYGLLQAALAAALLFFLRTTARPNPRDATALAAAFGFGVFTHIGMLLAWLPLATVAFLGFRRELVGRQAWTAAGLLAALAVAGVFVLLNSVYGVSTSGRSTGFVGDHLLELAPSAAAFVGFHGGGFGGVASAIVVGALAVIGLKRTRSFAAWTVVTAYFLPAALICLIIPANEPRYLLPIQPALALAAALGAAVLVPTSGRGRAWVMAGVAVLVLAAPVSGTARLFTLRTDADYRPAVEWIEGQGGHEPVVSAMAPVAWIGLSEPERIVFLAGPAEGTRVTRYTLLQPDGTRTDFWNGGPAIVTIRQLCDVLRTPPPPYLLVDGLRLGATWAYRGDFARVIRGATSTVYESESVRVLRPIAEARWSAAAREACAGSPEP